MQDERLITCCFYHLFLGFLFSSFFLVSLDTPPFSIFKSVRVSLWMGTSDNPWQKLSWAFDLLLLFPLVFYFCFVCCCVAWHASLFSFQVHGCPYEWVLAITPDRQYLKLLPFRFFFSRFSIFFFLCCFPWHASLFSFQVYLGVPMHGY